MAWADFIKGNKTVEETPQAAACSSSFTNCPSAEESFIRAVHYTPRSNGIFGSSRPPSLAFDVVLSNMTVLDARGHSLRGETIKLLDAAYATHCETYKIPHNTKRPPVQIECLPQYSGHADHVFGSTDEPAERLTFFTPRPATLLETIRAMGALQPWQYERAKFNLRPMLEMPEPPVVAASRTL